jgi:hypothetical protein
MIVAVLKSKNGLTSKRLPIGVPLSRAMAPAGAPAIHDRPVSHRSECAAADRKCALAAAVRLSLDEARYGQTMRTREMTPIWVWLTFGLMTIGTVLYLTGYFMVDDILSFFK